MTIYVLMMQDRHTDPEARLFSTLELAIAAARAVMDGNSDDAEDVDPEDAEMTDAELKEAGWLFYGCYSVEGDCVWVLPAEVDQED